MTDNALTLAMAEALEGDGGVRMTGGRFGGCVVAVCPAERRERLEVALRGHWARTGAVSPLQAVVAPSQAAQFL